MVGVGQTLALRSRLQRSDDLLQHGLAMISTNDIMVSTAQELLMGAHASVVRHRWSVISTHADDILQDLNVLQAMSMASLPGPRASGRGSLGGVIR